VAGARRGVIIARRGIPNRGEHCQAAERPAVVIEGHSTAAKFSQPGRLSLSVKVVRLKWKRPPTEATSPKSDQVFRLGSCECCRAVLPAISKEAETDEAVLHSAYRQHSEKAHGRRPATAFAPR